MGVSLARMHMGRGRFYGPASTPLTQYSALTIQEINVAWTGFIDPLPPNVSGAVIETTGASVVATAQANPGRQIRVTANDATHRTLTSCTDVEILVPNGVVLEGYTVTTGCTRVRIRGEGPTSTCKAVRFDGTATHCTAHSLLLTSSAGFSAVRTVTGATGPFAYISCICGAGNNGAFDCGLLDAGQVLIANCNLGADGNGGVNDWCLRQSGSHIVMVDCFAEARGLQPVLRRSNGSRWFMKRVTTYNSADNECFADVGDGTNPTVVNAYVYDSESFIGGTGVRIGGGTGTITSNVWRISNHTYRSPTGNVNSATLATAESAGPAAPNDWQYRIGSPQYLTWDGSTHPGWPTRTGLHGSAMNPSNPYSI